MKNFYEKEWTALEEEVNRRGGDGKAAADALRIKRMLPRNSVSDTAGLRPEPHQRDSSLWNPEWNDTGGDPPVYPVLSLRQPTRETNTF